MTDPEGTKEEFEKLLDRWFELAMAYRPVHVIVTSQEIYDKLKNWPDK